MNTRKIVAIGGGEIEKFKTLDIDKEIVRLSGKKHPKALFIPTASNDDKGKFGVFQKVYGKKLGCNTDVLYLIKSNPTKKQIRNKILSSDLIYVGGGNTLKMMRLWRRLGVDRILENAYHKGVVLSGKSAGAICWFKYGHSDSLSFYKPAHWDYIRVRGMGIIDALACPHYNKKTGNKKRSSYFQRMIKKYGGIGIATDDNCAIEFINDKYKIITSKKNANAYKIYKKNGELVVKIIEQKRDLTPLAALLKRQG